MNLTGKTFQVSAYDAYAKYEVVEDYPEDGTCLIVNVKENDWDYAAPLLDERCVVSRENVEKVIEWSERWKV